MQCVCPARNGILNLKMLSAHLNIEGDIYQSAAEQNYWLTTDTGETLLQDFGHFTTATADIISPPPDCNCINVARYCTHYDGSQASCDDQELVQDHDQRECAGPGLCWVDGRLRGVHSSGGQDPVPRQVVGGGQGGDPAPEDLPGVGQAKQGGGGGSW